MPAMELTTVLLLLAAGSVAAFLAGRARAIRLNGGPGNLRYLHSLPDYYGYFAALAGLLPALGFLLAWVLLEQNVILGMVVARLPDDVSALGAGQLDLFINAVRNAAAKPATVPADPVVAAAAADFLAYSANSGWIAAAASLVFAATGFALALRRIEPGFRARNKVETVLRWFLVGASTIAILTTVGIVVSVLSEALAFFEMVPLTDFLFGTSWSPQTAIRADQVGASGSFGIVPLLAGTLLITTIAMLVATPVGLMSAIYLAEYATPKLRAVLKSLLEVLAGIPTVVYGFFAVMSVAPWLRHAGAALGLDIASESALAAGIVMGIMIIPLISSLSFDAIRAAPESLREGAIALGATRSEVLLGIILPTAAPGILGGVLLAVSRAIGETMIVVMAASLAANMTVNPLEAVTTVTVQIVTLLVGDQEFESARTLSAFALGLVLFVITMALNIVGLAYVRRFRERYE